MQETLLTPEVQQLLLPLVARPCWSDAFSIPSLRRTYSDLHERDRHHHAVAGIDRLSVRAFGERAEAELELIQRKVLAGTYRFSPFLQHLKHRKPTQTPRVLSIPTIRDRIALRALKHYLDHHLHYTQGPRPRSSVTCVQATRSIISSASGWCLRSDIRDCFPTIPHRGLLDTLEAAGVDSRCLGLVEKLIRTPTLPAGRSSRGQTVEVGVPQGLCTSSLLANAYLSNLDCALRGRGVQVVRYVDDMVLFHDDGATLRSLFSSATDKLLLEENEEKTRCAPVDRGFQFLGYHFHPNLTSISGGAVQRFVSEIARRVARFRHSSRRNRDVSSFLYDVNLKITGAVKGQRRFGWLFHYIQMDDLTQLHRTQRTVRSIVARTGLQSQLKRLPRAYYEARHRPRAGYIVDYDAVDSVDKMRRNLMQQGDVDVDRLSDLQVADRFIRRREEHLKSLLQDAFFTS